VAVTGRWRSALRAPAAPACLHTRVQLDCARGARLHMGPHCAHYTTQDRAAPRRALRATATPSDTHAIGTIGGGRPGQKGKGKAVVLAVHLRYNDDGMWVGCVCAGDAGCGASSGAGPASDPPALPMMYCVVNPMCRPCTAAACHPLHRHMYCHAYHTCITMYCLSLCHPVRTACPHRYCVPSGGKHETITCTSPTPPSTKHGAVLQLEQAGGSWGPLALMLMRQWAGAEEGGWCLLWCAGPPCMCSCAPCSDDA
jgi:hypothetical protein